MLALQRTAGNAAVTRLLARTPQTDTVKAMQGTKGYTALTEAERKRLDALIGGGTSLSTHAHPKMKALLDKVGTNKDAAATFRDFLKGTSWLNYDVRLPGERRRTPDTHTVDAATDVKDHPFRSGTADAKKTVVKVEGTWPDGTKETHSIPIFAPKTFAPPKPGRVLPSAADIAKMVAALPLQSRARIKRIDLNPKANPGDAHWQADPNYNPSGGEFVSQMAAGADGTVHVFPHASNTDLKELETTLNHETGHAVSDAAWGYDEKDAKWDRWRKARKDDGISVSRYGNSSDGEDFAESWILYMTAYGTPLEAEVSALIPNRCKILNEFVQHKKPPPPAAPAPAAKPVPVPAK
jgi:hypothetical protein